MTRDPQRISHRSRLRGNILGMTMAIVMLLVVVGAALGMVATLNLNMAATQEYGQRAELLARAGINQFLEDFSQGRLDGLALSPSATPSPGPLESILTSSFAVPAPTPAPAGAAALQAAFVAGSQPYPLPNSHLPGSCYITLNPGLHGIAWSTWNADGTTVLTGYLGRPVPAFSVDVVANAQVGSVTRRLAVHALRRWTYSVASRQPVYLETPAAGSCQPLYPTRIIGDVLSATCACAACSRQSVSVGYGPNACAKETGTLVCGRALTTNTSPCSIKVNSPNNSVTELETGYRTITLPCLQCLPDPMCSPSACASTTASTVVWTDVTTQFTQAHPAPCGSYFVKTQTTGYRDAIPGPPACPTVSRPVIPGAVQRYSDLLARCCAIGEPCCTAIPPPANKAGQGCAQHGPMCPVSPPMCPEQIPTACPTALNVQPSENSPPAYCSPVSTTTYKLDHATVSSSDKPAALALSNGYFYVPGNLTIDSNSGSAGLNLTNATLHVHGNLTFTSRPTQVIGNHSAISVGGDFRVMYGFLQSDPQNGFVVKAKHLYAMVGGDFRGLVVATNGVAYLSQVNLNNSGPTSFVTPDESTPAGLGSCGTGTGSCCCSCCANHIVRIVCAPSPKYDCKCCSVEKQQHVLGACQPSPESSPAIACGCPTLGGPSVRVTIAAMNEVLPPGAPPGVHGVYPLHITGAIISPAISSPTAPASPLVVSSVAVTLDPAYLLPLHRLGAVTTRAWDELP